MLTPQERDAARTLRIAHDKRLQAIRADKTLSVTGKQQAIARAVLGTRGALKQLRADSDARDARRRRDLEARLFGHGGGRAADMISARDAAERAAACKTAAEAQRLLHTAELNGDAVLARAVFAQAWASFSDMKPGWGAVARGYLENRPEDNAAAAELAGILDPGRGERMSDRICTELAQPSDLMGSPEAIAARAEPQTAGG